jgi:hypothetical protein
MKLFVVLSFFLGLSVKASDRGIKNDVDFFAETAHLDFAAPKSCSFEVTIDSQKATGSFQLNGKACGLSEIDLKGDRPKKVDAFICAMLVTALNTTGKDLFTSCDGKKTTDNVSVFSNCGPHKNLRVELNLTKPSVSIQPNGSTDPVLTFGYKYNDERVLFPDSVGFHTTLFNQKIDRIA